LSTFSCDIVHEYVASRVVRIRGVGLPGFGEARRLVGNADYYLASGGHGPPVLLLHGFPETHLCWQAVAPALAARHAVVAPDLRGCGASRAPAGGPHGEGFSKREMAGELVELMSALGHERFAVVGHDRGARVAYRLALDDPERVDRVAIVNTVPTVEQFERMGADASLGFWPWLLLAQPAPFPERLFGSDPAAVLDHVFSTWPADPGSIGPEAREAYLRALDPPTIAAICADYRASFHIDRRHDAEDREVGWRITAPLLLVTGEEEAGLAEAPAIWRAWADDVTAVRVPGGHFVPEEAPQELAAELIAFLEAGPASPAQPPG
jgi:haloacetate dehalogenase